MQNRRRRRCDQDCQDHIFYFKKIGSSSKYDYSDSFCPKYQRDPLVPQHTLPIFNNDQKYYTSSFILGVQIRQLQKNLQHELMAHQKLVRDSMQKPTQIKFPRPNPKHSKLPTCSVCKVMCTNYYQHIRSIEHHENIQNNLYNKFLLQLCQNYRQFWDGCQERADLDMDRISQISQKDEDQEKNQNQNQKQDQYESDSDDQNQYLNQNEKIYRKKSRKRPPMPLLCDIIKKKIKIDYGESYQYISLKAPESDSQASEQYSAEQQQNSIKIQSEKKIEQKINSRSYLQKESQENNQEEQKPQQKIESALYINSQKDIQRSSDKLNSSKSKDKYQKKQQNQEKYYLRTKNNSPTRSQRYPQNQYRRYSKSYKYEFKTDHPSSQKKIIKNSNQPIKIVKKYQPSNLEPYPQYLKKMQKKREQQQRKISQQHIPCETNTNYYNHHSRNMFNMYQPPISQQRHPSFFQNQPYYYNNPASAVGSQQPNMLQKNNFNQSFHTNSHQSHSYIGNTNININFPVYISPEGSQMNAHRNYHNPYDPYQSYPRSYSQYHRDYPSQYYHPDRKNDKK